HREQGVQRLCNRLFQGGEAGNARSLARRGGFPGRAAARHAKQGPAGGGGAYGGRRGFWRRRRAAEECRPGQPDRAPGRGGRRGHHQRLSTESGWEYCLLQDRLTPMSKHLGIDIRSTHVRVAELEVSYRRSSINTLYEVERSRFSTLVEAVRACAGPLVAESETIAIPLAGERRFVHRIELPLTAPRQSDEGPPFE